MNNKAIEELFLKNKLLYKMTELPNDVTGISYYENNYYLIIINTAYSKYRENLIDNVIEILSNNFYCDKQNRSIHDKNIEKIIFDLKTIARNKI